MNAERSKQRRMAGNHGSGIGNRCRSGSSSAFIGILCSAFVLSCSSFGADVPAAIDYQGKLVDHLGNAAMAGAYRVEFRIWDDATGTGAAHLVWGREYPVNATTGGLFSVLLADVGGTAATNPAPQTDDLLQAFQGADRYLGLTIAETPAGPVGSPEEIAPRQRLAGAPFVFSAQSATDAEQATGGFRVQNGLTVGSGGIEVAGAAALHGPLAVDGFATFAGALVVDETLTATTQPTAVHGLHVHSGGAQFDGTATVSGNFAVDPPAVLAGHGTVPVGAIIMWSGASNAIPQGWALCDGGTHSGHATPDLRARFVVGAGRQYSHGDVGGESRHELTIGEMPSHHHVYYLNDEDKGYILTEHDSDGFWKNTKSASTEDEGEGVAHENRPPYYALCYVMRVQ